MCIGYKFAIEEAVTTLAKLYRRYSFRLVSEEPLQLRLGVTIAPKHGLPVYVEARAKASLEGPVGGALNGRSGGLEPV